MEDKIRKIEEQNSLRELSIPDYVILKEKYKCDKCRFNKKNVQYKYRFPHKLKYVFSNCSGNPARMTQCKKRCWVFYDLFSLLTAGINVIAYLTIFSYKKDLLLALAYTYIFASILNIICIFIEYIIDKIFDNIEKIRKKIYDKKVSNIKAISEQKKYEEERQKEKKSEVYKDINDAKLLFEVFSNSYLEKIKQKSINAKKFKSLKKQVYKNYTTLLKSIENLLEYINLENFYFSEIKVLFQIHLPKLGEYVEVYLEMSEDEEVELQINELSKLIESFNIKIVQIKDNLNSSASEGIVYKMKALRKVVSDSEYEDE